MRADSLPDRRRRNCLIGAGWAAAGLGWAGWPLQPYAQGTGTTRLMSLRDSQRQRDVPVLIRFPAGSGPCPVVLYSHGLGGTRQGGEVWGDAWRAEGIAVIHVQHLGSDAEVLREGGPEALRDAMNPEQLQARVRDIRFVIDEIVRAPTRQDSPLQRLDVDSLGVAGHSFGALTVQALAGQRMPGFGDFPDSRPRAFIAFSPVPFGGDAAATVYAGITRPFLAVTGSQDGDLRGHRGGEARAAIAEGLPPGKRALLWLDGADHMTFAGSGARRQAAMAAAGGASTASTPANAPATTASPAAGAIAAMRRRDVGPIEREARHHALVARLTSQWWRAHLMGDRDAEAQLRAPGGLGPGDRWRV